VTHSTFDSKRTRLKLLNQRLSEVEQRLKMAAPIPVFRVRSCMHPECGATKPRNAPPDALFIYLGCKHSIPGTPDANV
jgi:hypothetical protein